MGGSALKNTETRRIPSTEYDRFKERVIEIVASKTSYDLIAVPLSLRSKESHGDVDVVVAKTGEDGKEQMVVTWKDAMLTLRKEFNSAEVFTNNDVVSFEFQQHQVDLIRVPARYFESTRFYFSWGDMSNLIGHVAKSLGLTYGTTGLYHVMVDGRSPSLEKEHRNVGTVMLTEDPVEALTFLGYPDPQTLRNPDRFDSLEDIFAYVAHPSSAFRPWMFGRQHNIDGDLVLREETASPMETRPGIPNRTTKRRKKRPSFHKFLEYVQTMHGDLLSHVHSPVVSSLSHALLEASLESVDRPDSFIRLAPPTSDQFRSHHISKAISHFNGWDSYCDQYRSYLLMEKANEKVRQWKLIELIKEEWLLDGRNLGQFMNLLRSELDSRVVEPDTDNQQRAPDGWIDISLKYRDKESLGVWKFWVLKWASLDEALADIRQTMDQLSDKTSK
ncbi:hypothetical protein BJ742DRAFT_822932 [Cladochytrium replicatum]|nr:hypothetical protein BJ742DRAFT_822932 [Cladochytrium replicatum]